MRQWFSRKNPPDLLVFWLWFSPPKQKIFRNLCFWKSFCRFFEKFVVFCGFSLYRLAFLSKGSDFHEKNPPDLLVFWLWFSPPSEKIFRNLCIPKKIWRFLEKFASVLCAKATIEHAASGWCAAVIFWKKSTRFAGFLAVIFTSQGLLAQGNHRGFFKAKKSSEIYEFWNNACDFSKIS